MLNTDWKELHGNAFEGARCLVTGGAGFIGSHVVEALTALGAKLIVLDNLVGGSRQNIATFGAELVVGSILDEGALSQAADGCEFVFHLAALGSVPHSVEKPIEYHEVDATGTVRVLEAARRAGAARVVYSASSAAYGDSQELPKRESMPTAPKSPYAAAKLAGEAYVSAYAGCYNLDTVSLRYFNIFGPRQNANSAYAAVIAAFAKAILSGNPPTIFGDGKHSRDFTFVHNAVHANLLAARCDKPLRGTVFNVACGERIDLNTLAPMMCELLGRADLKPVYAPERAGDVKHSQADLAKIREAMRYQPIVHFRQGLKSTVEWYRSVL
ncbi:MAG: NAD-dependent epimerase/dehydratase family protein [Tepidisphaeraceae bacterium]